MTSPGPHEHTTPPEVALPPQQRAIVEVRISPLEPEWAMISEALHDNWRDDYRVFQNDPDPDNRQRAHVGMHVISHLNARMHGRDIPEDQRDVRGYFSTSDRVEVQAPEPKQEEGVWTRIRQAGAAIVAIAHSPKRQQTTDETASAPVRPTPPEPVERVPGGRRVATFSRGDALLLMEQLLIAKGRLEGEAAAPDQQAPATDAAPQPAPKSGDAPGQSPQPTPAERAQQISDFLERLTGHVYNTYVEQDHL